MFYSDARLNYITDCVLIEFQFHFAGSFFLDSRAALLLRTTADWSRRTRSMKRIGRRPSSIPGTNQSTRKTAWLCQSKTSRIDSSSSVNYYPFSTSKFMHCLGPVCDVLLSLLLNQIRFELLC